MTKLTLTETLSTVFNKRRKRQIRFSYFKSRPYGFFKLNKSKYNSPWLNNNYKMMQTLHLMQL